MNQSHSTDDSGYGITTRSSSQELNRSQEGHQSTTSDDDVSSVDEHCEPIPSDSDPEEKSLQKDLQNKYSQVMGLEVAKLSRHVPFEEFRLFCYNITPTPDNYCMMVQECSRSIDVWCRISMKCNYCHFAPLESVCRYFDSDALQLVNRYKEFLCEEKFKTIISKTKPYDDYQSMTEPKELFASCVVNIAISLNSRIIGRNVSMDDMKSYFCTLKVSPLDQELFITNSDIQHNITKAGNVFFLLFAISPCWDYINFLFLEEHVVKPFGGHEEKQELEKYKHDLRNRWSASTVQRYPDMRAELTCYKNCSQIKCTINAEWDTTKIKHILRLKEVIASVYNIDVSAVKLFKVTKGSIIAYFTLPSSCIKDLSDEHILLLADHEFLKIEVFDFGSIDEDEPIISCNISERFITLDNSFKAPTATYDTELCSNVSLFEQTKGNSATPQDFQPKKVFKHWANYYIVLHTFTTCGRLDIYRNERSYTSGKGPIDSRSLYGIDVEMKSKSKKPYVLVLTTPHSCLSISLTTQTDAQQWFIALTQIVGCFHLQLKMSPCHRSIPDLVVQLKDDYMIFWSVTDQLKCMEWRLCDINSIHLHRALYINIKSSSNTPLKEDIFVFEGEQLEKLFDLLEEHLLALPDNSLHEEQLYTSLVTKLQIGTDNKLKHSLSQEVLGNDTVKQIKRTQSMASLTSEESGSLDSFSMNSSCIIDDILNEMFSAESGSTVYHRFSWKVKDEVHLQDKVIQFVKTSWFDLKSRHILNRGYCIIITLPGQQTRILAQEKCNPEGKKQIQNRWEEIVSILNKAYIVFEEPNCIKKIGSFQAHTMVVEIAEVHDFNLPHFQTVYYGTLEPSRMLHPSTDYMKDSFYMGMAQCTVPPALLKQMYSNLSKNGFLLRLWHSSPSYTNIRINYLNEFEQDEFEKVLDESFLDSKHPSPLQNSEILLYIPSSSKPFNENLAQTSQLAVDLGFSGKVVLFDWCTEKETDGIYQAIMDAKPQLLDFLELLCSQASKVHIIAVHDGALLLVKALTDIKLRLGQVILTRLASISSSIFAHLQAMVHKSESFLYQAENVTVYHKPKSCKPSVFPLRSFTVGNCHDILPKTLLLEPPPLVQQVDIICLGRHPNRCLIKNREYAVNKVVIEDMSEIICFGKGVKDRSSRLRIQCGCTDLRLPTDRSHFPCKKCNCYNYFVLGRVYGLGNFMPAVLEEMQRQMLRQYHAQSDANKLKKYLTFHRNPQTEQILCHQHRRSL